MTTPRPGRASAWTIAPLALAFAGLVARESTRPEPPPIEPCGESSEVALPPRIALALASLPAAGRRVVRGDASSARELDGDRTSELRVGGFVDVEAATLRHVDLQAAADSGRVVHVAVRWATARTSELHGPRGLRAPAWVTIDGVERPADSRWTWIARLDGSVRMHGLVALDPRNGLLARWLGPIMPRPRRVAFGFDLVLDPQ